MKFYEYIYFENILLHMFKYIYEILLLYIY